MADKRTPGPGDGLRTQSEASGGRPRLPLDCGDFEIAIQRDGTWLYRGSPIRRMPLVKLFASVLQRDEAGGYWLETPVERGRVTVEDAPFTAVALETRGEGRNQELIFRTNIDDSVTADAEHPLRVSNDASGTPNPYILVRNMLEARLTRPVFYELVELGGEEKIGDSIRYGVWSKGRFFPIDGGEAAS